MSGRRIIARWMSPVSLVSLLLVSSAPGNDQVPGALQKKPVALVGGAIYPVDGEPILKGTLVFDGGKIVALGTEVKIPSGAVVIDIEGKRVYPGLIASATQIGLSEIRSVRATLDYSELGDMNPNVRAEVSVNPDSEHIPVARANGIALAVSRPRGGLISGSSALLRLDGWTWEEMVVEAPLGMEISWPRNRSRGRRGGGRPPGGPPPSTNEAGRRVAAIQKIFDEARAYEKARSNKNREHPQPVDLRLEALLPVITGKRPVFIHANGESEIRAAVAWARDEKLRMVLVGGVAAPNMASFLAENKVAVIYGPVYENPARRDLPYHTPFSGPGKLSAAGVKFAIASFETSLVRNLPYHAGTAAAHGLSPEEALRAITLSAAEILGVANRYGSLTPGKSATLMVTDGDPLEVVTRVERLWIDGRPVDLTSRHTSLYEKYAERIARELRIQGY